MSRENFELQQILERKSNNLPSHPAFVSKVLAREVKLGNYKTGEVLFEYLTAVLKEKKNFKQEYIYNEMEAASFQRSAATMVRYAPTTEKARYMFNLTFSKFDPPFRTVALEITLLNNLLYVHTQANEMKNALSLIEVALEIRVFQMELSEIDFGPNLKFSNPLEVFETLSSKVLRYYRMEFNEDKTEIKHVKKQFSR